MAEIIGNQVIIDNFDGCDLADPNDILQWHANNELQNVIVRDYPTIMQGRYDAIQGVVFVSRSGLIRFLSNHPESPLLPGVLAIIPTAQAVIPVAVPTPYAVRRLFAPVAPATDFQYLTVLRHAAMQPEPTWRPLYMMSAISLVMPPLYRILIENYHINSTVAGIPADQKVVQLVHLPDIAELAVATGAPAFDPAHQVTLKQLFADVALFDYSVCQEMDNADQLKKKGSARASAILATLNLPPVPNELTAFTREHQRFFVAYWDMIPDMKKWSAYLYAAPSSDPANTISHAYHTHMRELVQWHGMTAIKMTLEYGSPSSAHRQVLFQLGCAIPMQNFARAHRAALQNLPTWPPATYTGVNHPARVIPFPLLRRGDFDLQAFNKANYGKLTAICVYIGKLESGNTTMDNFVIGRNDLPDSDKAYIKNTINAKKTAEGAPLTAPIAAHEYMPDVWGTSYEQFKVDTTTASVKESIRDKTISAFLDILAKNP